MEDQLHRLTLLVAIAAFLVFGGASAYSFYQAHSYQTAVNYWADSWNRSIDKCEKNRQSSFCESIERKQNEFDSAVNIRDRHREKAKMFLTATIAIPVLSFILFFGLRWVITGRLPQLRRAQGVVTNQPEHATRMTKVIRKKSR